MGAASHDTPPSDRGRPAPAAGPNDPGRANTRADGEEFLALAARLGLRVTTEPYSLRDADRALADLAHDRVTGAAVLVV